MSMGAVGGAVVGGLASGAASAAIGGLFGDDGGGGGTSSGAQFLPYTLTSGFGESRADINEDTGHISSNAKLTPQLQSMADSAFGYASPFSNIIQSQARQRIPLFDFNYDPNQATMDYFNAGYNVLRPELDASALSIRDKLWGSGILGQNATIESLGAGTGGGLLNKGEYGLNLAQSRALAELWANSRDKALAEEKQRYNVMSNMFGINRDTNQMYLENLMTGQNHLMNLGTGLFNMEDKLAQRGSALSSGVAWGGQTSPYETMTDKLIAGVAPGIVGGIGTAVKNWWSPQAQPTYAPVTSNVLPTTKYGAMHLGV